jgi:predicted O-methyltransferase YrrM
MLEHVRAAALAGESDVLRRLREETAGLEDAIMQISPEQGRLMAVLARGIGAGRALEVGVFTGYSALCVAQELPADGRLVACDLSEEWTSIAQRYWEEAGVAGLVDLRLGPAEETLAELARARETFDFAFIDADKAAYGTYFEWCVQLVRPGGMIAVDNMFLGGRVWDEAVDDPGARAVRALTEGVQSDPRVDASLLPIGDGLLLALRREG